jgi:hypothetical protein
MGLVYAEAPLGILLKVSLINQHTEMSMVFLLSSKNFSFVLLLYLENRLKASDEF